MANEWVDVVVDPGDGRAAPAIVAVGDARTAAELALELGRAAMKSGPRH